MVTDNPATTPKPDGDGHRKDVILNAAQKTTVKLYENNGCSGNELEFKVSHPEQNCKYCLDTCNERFTTDPSIDAHLKVKSVMIYDDQDIGFIGTTYRTCSGSFGYVDPGFQNMFVTSNKCVDLPSGFAHIVFWAKESQSNYTTVESLTDNLQV